jgi:hypothetical protein
MTSGSGRLRARRPELGLWAAVAAGIAVLGVAWGLLHVSPLSDNQIVDVGLYERVGEAVLDGSMPYRDFDLEYPPGALPAFILPALASDGDYRGAFELGMLLCGLVLVVLVGIALAAAGASGVRVAAGCALAGVAPLALGSVVLTRFDLWPAVLTAGALAALAADRGRLGVGVLGLAAMAKIYPAVLLPLALVYVARQRGGREALVCLGVFAGVVLAIMLPFAIVDAGGLLSSFTRQAGRPLQVETLGSSLLLAGGQAGWYDPTVVSSHGSQNLAGGLPDAVAAVQTAFQILAVLGIWMLFALRRGTLGELFVASAASVAAFASLGKVLSPQFLIWLVPLVPLVLGPLGVAASAVLLVALALTQLGFPHRYWDLVALDPGPTWLLLTRNAVMVGLVALLAVGLGRGERGGT